MLRILLGKGETSRLQFVSIIIIKSLYNNFFLFFVSDIHCVSATTIVTASDAIMSIIDFGSYITSHTALLMSDCSCTSMIETVTVMPSCALTEQVCSDTQTG